MLFLVRDKSTRNIKFIFWFIVIAALIKSILFSRVGFGLLDEGESLHNATRILNGEIPYRDFFAIFPPLDNYIFAFIFSVFGKSVFIPRLVMSCIFAFAPAFMFLILTKYVKNRFAILPALLMVFLDLNVERLYFFTLLFIAIYLFDKKTFLAGFLFGLISLIRADLPGTYVIGLGLAVLSHHLYIKSKFKTIFIQLSSFCVGYSLPIMAGIYWMFKNGILGLFVEAAFKNSISITKLHDLPFPLIGNIIPSKLTLPSLSGSYEAGFSYLVLVVYFIFTIYFLRNWNQFLKDKYIFFGLLLAGLLAMPYIFGRSDMGHIVKGGMSVLFLASFLISKIRNKNVSIVSTFIILGIFLANVIQSTWWLKFNDTKTNIGGYKLKLNSSYISKSTSVSENTLSEAVTFLKNSNTEEKVLALPYLAGVYFLADRQPPVGFNNLLAGFIVNEKQENDFIEKVKQENVKRIVYARGTGPKMKNNTLVEYNPLIHEFIMSNYAIVRETPEGWLFMLKNK